jgi:hypothetical protein
VQLLEATMMLKRTTISLALMSALACSGCSQTRQPAVSASVSPPIRDVESVNTVTGSFTVDPIFNRRGDTPITVKPTQAYARFVKNRKDETKQDVVILLSEQPLNRRAIAAVEATNVEDGDKNLRAVLSNRDVRGIQLRLAVDRKAAAEVKEKIQKRLDEGTSSSDDEDDRKRGDSTVIAYYNGENHGYLPYELEIKSFSADSVEGHIKEFGTTKCKADLSFTVKLQPDGWTGGGFYRLSPTKLEPGRASGQIEIDGKPVKLNYVYARLLHYDFFDEGNNTLKLWFTEKPVDEAALGEDSPKTFLAIKHGGNGVVLLYQTTPASDPSESEIWYVAKIGDQTTNFSLLDFRDLRERVSGTESDYFKLDDQTLEGRLYTTTAVKTFDHTYKIEVLFNAAIVQPDPAKAPVTTRNGGQPLPADGGAPGKAYFQALEKLRAAKNFAEMVDVWQSIATAEIAATMKSELAALSAEQQDFVFQSFRPPDNSRIVSGLIKDNKATLRIAGTKGPNKYSEVVNMHLENGQWKLGQRKSTEE